MLISRTTLVCLFTILATGSSFAFGDVNSFTNWTTLTEAFPGKQDDVFFIDAKTGWYGNGKGFIYKTKDGGVSWEEQFHQQGTFIRALGFVDENLGFAGNIGPDYFPGVTDSNPLYRTRDGGKTWSPVSEVTFKELKGVCAIDILKSKYINSGFLDERVTIRAAGRVGGPAKLVTSRDGGETWKAQDLSDHASMIMDVKFLDEQTGFICAASHSDITQSHARILKTSDGGDSWQVVYESQRPMELTWKCDFPSSKVGYATIQSYNPDPTQNKRFVAKTSDGGESWVELLLVEDHSVREFGVGFLDELTGWVGAIKGIWFTKDGGITWTHQDAGRAVNKFRIVRDEHGSTVFSIGLDVRKLEVKRFGEASLFEN